ncbi:hypothetical protein AYO22_03017 [Fonsecaea multimorphosa]|nr:hypothetical protein AYO22_03017 [Fonsecaea multimorphosa]
MSDQSLAHIFIPSSPSELQVVDQMRNILMQSLTQLRTSDPSQSSFIQSCQIPDTETLDRYQKMFFAMPNKNLPFTHESLPILENAPAFNLAILADGAMYCGDYSPGILLFEASRRLAENHLEKIGSTNVPLWLLNTLLANSVFGLPGGDEASPEVTIGSLQSLIYLASRVSEPTLPMSPLLSQEDYQWRDFICKESKKRSLLCVLVMTGLWSTAYGPIQNSAAPFFDQIELPCAEILWTSTSAEQWKGLSRTARPPEKLREVVLRLLNGSNYACSGLASLSIVVSLLVYMDELRIGASGDLSGFRAHLVTAINRWDESHSQDRRENNSINFIAFPAAAYLRVFLEVNIRSAMAAFLKHDFCAMRDFLRDGDLKKAGVEALSGLVPWASCHKNQISMVAIPLALVVSESVLEIANQPFPLTHGESSLLKHYGDALALEDQSVNPVSIWQALRNIISNGPVTLVLLTALEAYEAELEHLQAPPSPDPLPEDGH